MAIVKDTEHQTIVIVPIYKKNPSKEELENFSHNLNVLKNHPFCLIAPEGLDTKAYQEICPVNTEFFPEAFFRGLEGYNKLMLSKDFYLRFASYKYMLICQLDVFIFSDDLTDWTNKDYDYVGAPWINRWFEILLYVLVKTGVKNTIRLLFTRNIVQTCGNGGLSLRKISRFINADNKKCPIEKWTANEDFYWSFYAKNNGKYLTKPKAKEAALFCIETNPAMHMKHQKNTLPMGIHAWQRYVPGFWDSYIQNAKNSVKLT